MVLASISNSSSFRIIRRRSPISSGSTMFRISSLPYDHPHAKLLFVWSALVLILLSAGVITVIASICFHRPKQLIINLIFDDVHFICEPSCSPPNTRRLTDAQAKCWRTDVRWSCAWISLSRYLNRFCSSDLTGEPKVMGSESLELGIGDFDYSHSLSE